MKNFVQPGDVLTFTAPAGGVVAGMGYKIGQTFVVAAYSADAGAPFEGQVTGVFDLPKNASQAFAEGALLYWSDANQNLTTTATANMLIGTCAQLGGHLAAATVGRVRLSGAPRPDEA